MPDAVILHHPQGIPGITIKTKSGVHYTFNQWGEIEIPAHLAHIEGAKGDAGHVAHFIGRGHRLGIHPNHRRHLEDQQAGPSPVLHETAAPEEAESVEQPAQVEVSETPHP